ncbi:hypothetical protein ABT142_18890 [Streptomyces sp. NPDC001857]
MARERVWWPAVVDRAREIVESYEGGGMLRQVFSAWFEGVSPLGRV